MWFAHRPIHLWTRELLEAAVLALSTLTGQGSRRGLHLQMRKSLEQMCSAAVPQRNVLKRGLASQDDRIGKSLEHLHSPPVSPKEG